MGREGRDLDQEGVLREVLRISRAQKALFRENRLEDLLLGQSRREALLNSLVSGLDYKKEPYRSIINEIIANDRHLSLAIETLRDEVGSRLKKIRSGVKVMKAYCAG